MDRREFVVTAGAIVASLPVALAKGGNESADQAREDFDWTVDDMWVGYPRNAEAIGYGRPRDVNSGEIDGADRYFIP